ncbi:hypothetical protein BJ741DRAFT_606825 [Chytriomyces cf. hyalinus JEL632]|nr:hypothetical protein BJ741DRAFT_606825 [Chytriomyces cf. hyalinus JEL632]
MPKTSRSSTSDSRPSKASLATFSQSTPIFSIYSTKIVALIKDETTLDINLSRETDSGALFVQSVPNTTSTRSDNCELTIDGKYLVLDTLTVPDCLRLASAFLWMIPT